MKKILSITLKVLAALVTLFIAAAIVLPIIFKPQLMQVAKKEANSMLNAKVDFTDFQVSLIKGFPNLYVGMKGLTVVGIDSFANDTLVAFKEFGVKAKVEGNSVALTFQGVTTIIGNNAQAIEQYLLGIGNVQFAGGPFGPIYCREETCGAAEGKEEEQAEESLTGHSGEVLLFG